MSKERFIEVGVFEVKEDAKTHIFGKYDEFVSMKIYSRIKYGITSVVQSYFISPLIMLIAYVK